MVVEKDDKDRQNRDEASNLWYTSNLLTFLLFASLVYYFEVPQYIITSITMQELRHCKCHWMCEFNKTPFR